MVIKSYPKVNLFFLIDKYIQKKDKHKINSVYKKVYSVYDEITITESNKNDSIKYFDKENSQIKVKNCIIKKTLSILRKKRIIKSFYNISIIKKIPFGSGVGGGSSNAGEVIKFILKNENKKITKKIFKIAMEIGSDVPFFLKDYDIAMITSFGEKIKKYPFESNFDIKLYFSKINCSTKKVYETYKNNPIKLSTFKEQIECLKKYEFYKLKNELIDSCFKNYPEVEKQYNKFINKGEIIKLSGSGSTLFKIIKR